MKRILSIVLTMAIIFSAIGSLGINPETAYARMGVDINGNAVENTNIYQPTDDPVYYYQPPVDENGDFDYFGYPMYDDPQDIPDDEFFGKWDEVDNKWVKGPYFNYPEFPDLAKVEEAAKKGDYETAKREIHAYYLNVAPQRSDTEAYGGVTQEATEIFEGWSRNIYAYAGGAMSMGGFYVPANEFEKITIDVDSFVHSAVKGAFPEFSVEIASGDKFWTTAEVCSKEAENPADRPYLSAIVNGIYTEFRATDDAMVVAGVCGDINYGSEPVISVQEHGTFDNVDSSYGSYDEHTKRMFVSFDVSSLSKNDKISNMKIHITARNVITEETKQMFADEDGNPYVGEADRDKLLWAVWYKDSAWTEDTLTWNTGTIMDKMYFSCHDMEAWDYISNSNPSIKGKVCDFHRNTSMGKVRSSWMKTRDEKYAYTLLRQEMALINSLGCEPLVMNSLDMSTHVNGLVPVFFATLDSKYSTPDVCTTLLKFMWQLSNWQVEYYFGRATNNWGTFATSSVYNVVTRCPEFVTHDYWYQRVLEDNTRMLSGFVFEDGLCVEMPNNYVATLLETMATPIGIMNRTGHPGPFEEHLYEDIYNYVQTLIYTSNPYFGGFNQGDAVDLYKDFSGTFKTWYEYLFQDDEKLEWLVTKGMSGKMPDNPTTVYPTSYKTFMRSGWDEKSLQLAFINTSDSRRSHQHNDSLSFAMFAYGSYLLVDPGYGGDQTGDGGRVLAYNRSPVQHNLVTINDTYDYLYDGVCAATTIAHNSSGSRDFETNKYYDYQEYYSTGYSSSPLMQRSITFLKEQGFWIVSDYNIPNEPEKENVFAQHWHTRPDSNMTYDEKLALRTNFDDGPNVQVIPVEWEELDGLEWVDTYYAEYSGQKVVTPKAMYTKTQTGTGRFTTIILPEDLDDDFSVSSTALKNKSGLDDSLINGAYFRITDENTGDISNYMYYHINDDKLKPEGGVEIDDYITDATTLVVQTNDKDEVVSAFMVNGSFVKDTVNDEYLIKTEKPETMSFKRNGFFVNIMSSQYEDVDALAGLQLYMPNVKAARFDGDDVSVEIDDGVMLFDGTYGASNIPSSGGGSGGGGGGAGGTKPVKPEDTKPEDTKPEDTKPEDEKPVDPAVSAYDDVDEDDWFFEYVEQLTEFGIVSGDGTGKFNPTDNVTREQFLKMLVEAAGIESAEAENTFDDVLDMWYKPYVLKAKNFGIVNGVSDTEFGIGSNITRQDMAVMISRTIDKLGIRMSENDVSAFADYLMVSDYAKDSVFFMKSIGLIEGYNNEFRPLDKLTRAEAAKVICEFVGIIS